MDDERRRFRTLMDLVGDALELPSEQRESFLREQCPEEILEEALDLLRESDSQAAISYNLDLRIAADAAGLTQDATDPEEDLPRSIGPYRLVAKLGEGGMGVVYRAHQSEPLDREIALKLIRRGIDSQAVIKRFEAERQVLARMEHPGIAAIHDAGTTEDGRPWYAMELVDGTPVIEYCNRERLGLRDRLELFVRICEAVQHAHHKGVIHRDLKPSNVLVTDHEGRVRPKIIDFGIAKSTDLESGAAALLTSDGMLIGTLEYMSPEQAHSHPGAVDARSDIYSLGVLLYQLVCGHLPIEGERLRGTGIREALRVLQEEEPLRPSQRLESMGADAATIAGERSTGVRALGRQLRGDLDWVIMRALAKDPERRYQTAHELAEEIARYLRHEPVEAGPPTRRYRVGRFVRRHRVGVAAAGAVVVALLMGTVLAGIGLLRARDAERHARAEAATSQATTKFLQDMLSSVKPEKAQGEEITVRMVLTEAERRLEKNDDLAGQPLVEAAMRLTVGETYQALGDFQAAAPQLDRALEIYEEQVGEEDDRTLRCLDLIGIGYWMEGELDASLELVERRLAIVRRMYGPEDPKLIDVLVAKATVLADQGKYESAEQAFREIVALDRERYARQPGDFLCYSLNNLATVLADLERWNEAIELHEESLALRRKFMGENSPAVVISIMNLAYAQRGKGDFEAAEKSYRQAAEMAPRILGEEHVRTGVAYSGLAATQYDLGQAEAAEANARRAIRSMTASLGPDAVYTARMHTLLGSILLDTGRLDEAEAELMHGYEVMRKSLDDEHPRMQEILERIAQLHEAQGDAAGAQQWRERLVAR